MKPYTIGIVTYHARFDDYFSPLINQVARIFPDHEIVCILNGHYDDTLQISYLNKATQFLKQFPNIRYISHRSNHSLAQCWNEIILLSKTDQVVIMNDDLQVYDMWREELERTLSCNDTFLINRTWSHFVISKKTVAEVGWFDERLPAVSWEDTDYAFRLIMHNKPIKSIKMLGIANFSAENKAHGWKNEKPEDENEKYASANERFFQKKWYCTYFKDNIPKDRSIYSYGQPYGLFALRNNMETPSFYDKTLLKSTVSEQDHMYKKSQLRILLQRTLFVPLSSLITTLRKIKRVIKKIKSYRPPI